MLIDSHCHLPHKSYGRPLEKVIFDARAAGVDKFISIGTSVENNELANKTANEYEFIYSTVAVYPHENLELSLEEIGYKLESQLTSFTKVVAVGECGLEITDWAGGRTVDEQVKLFELQINLALKYKLPVVIHNRSNDDIVFDVLKPHASKGLKGVSHCFAYDWETAKKFLDLDFYLGFSGMITYKTRNILREVVAKVPENRFLVETDAPYLPPEGFRGKPNEPAHVVDVARKIAEVRNIPFEKVAELSYSGTCKLFNI